MNNVVILNADDGKKWARFLSEEIQHLTDVDQYNVDALGPSYLRTLDLVCILLSPNMLAQKKKSIKNSLPNLQNPIIILCGVTRQEMENTVYCDAWGKCQILTVTSDKTTTTEFIRLIHLRLLKWNRDNCKLIPETLVKKANQSCVLLFSKPFRGDLYFEIDGYRGRLVAEMKDSKTYVINLPDLPGGKHTLLVFDFNKKIPIELSLTIVDTNTKKCGCEYLYKMLDSDDLQPLDDVLVTSMEKDYSNRLFYQNISDSNPENPEFPTPLHFAAANGMYKVLHHFMKNSLCREGLAIKNHKNMDCFDIAKHTGNTGIRSLLENNRTEHFYWDMSQTYTNMKRIEM